MGGYEENTNQQTPKGKPWYTDGGRTGNPAGQGRATACCRAGQHGHDTLHLCCRGGARSTLCLPPHTHHAPPPPAMHWKGGIWHKASVSDCLPLAAPIGLSPLHIRTLCGPERVLVVSTEPPDDLSCLTTPGVGRPGDGLGRGGGTPPPPLQGAQPTPSHCPPDAEYQLQGHL